MANNVRESPIRRDQRCTVGTVEHTVRRSLEEGAVDKLLVGEFGKDRSQHGVDIKT